MNEPPPNLDENGVEDDYGDDLLARLAQDTPDTGSPQAGERLGSSSTTPRNLAGSKHRSGDLLAIRRGNRLKYPGFQFRSDGTVTPGVRELRPISADHGWSESDLFLWMVVSTGRLDDSRPIDLLLSGSNTDQDRVVVAAELEMSTE